jgi:hypothetical protein
MIEEEFRRHGLLVERVEINDEDFSFLKKNKFLIRV